MLAPLPSTTRPLPNFEAPADEDSLNTYEFTVEAFDGTNTGTWDYAVTVTDVNETPELTGTHRNGDNPR